MNTSKLSVNDGVVYRSIDNKCYILSVNSQIVLYGSANVIWELLLEGYNYIEIVNKLNHIYDIDKQTVENDVRKILKSLYEKNIISIDNKISNCDNINLPEKRLEDNNLNDFYQDMKFLYKVVLEMTYNCNNKCEFCYNGGYIEKNYMSKNKIINIIDQCKEIGVMHLSFTGGEPFIRSDFLDIVEYAHNNNFYITIQTNGTLITEDIARVLGKFMPITVAITVHSADENIHDDFTKVKGSYRNTINNIKLLRKYNVPVVMRYVITKKNFSGIKAYSNLADELDVRYNISPLIYPSVDGSLEPFKLRLESDQIRYLIKEKKYAPQADPCGAGKTKIVISPEGKVYPCPFYHLEIGDLNTSKLKEIINSSNALNVRKLFERPQECKKCGVANKCPRCPIIAYCEEGKFDSINKYSCMIANLYNNYMGGANVDVR